MKWIVGIIFTALGIIMVLKTEWFLSFLGRNSWAEDKIGPGGTRLFYKLIGIGLILFSFMYVSGAFYRILDSIFGAGLGQG
ncbi:MAG: hypothetical protein U9M89_03170 [Patescibacteria group bacterium]|nr:hypothetical protein [Patescibacteria group bacterium]